MNASLDRIAENPPTFLLRLGDNVDPDPRWLDLYDGLAVVQVRADGIAVVSGMCVPNDEYDAKAREAIRVRLEDIGVREVRGFRVIRLKKKENVT